MPGVRNLGRRAESGRSGSIFSGTGALRIAVVAGLIVVGAVVLSQAFPSFESPVVDGVGPSVSASPSPTPTKTPKEPAPIDLTGTILAVFNGTNTPDLAAKTSVKLTKRFGVEVPQIGNAPSERAITGIYYDSNKDKAAAEYLKRFFPDADVGPLPADAQVDKGVQIAIYLGDDYASTLGA